MGVAEKVIAEPSDFLNTDERNTFMEGLKNDLYDEFKRLQFKTTHRLISERTEKYRKIGRYNEYTVNKFSVLGLLNLGN